MRDDVDRVAEESVIQRYGLSDRLSDGLKHWNRLLHFVWQRFSRYADERWRMQIQRFIGLQLGMCVCLEKHEISQRHDTTQHRVTRRKGLHRLCLSCLQLCKYATLIRIFWLGRIYFNAVTIQLAVRRNKRVFHLQFNEIYQSPLFVYQKKRRGA